MSKSIIVIPARMDSSRFPGKPLAEADGMPLVEWTWLQAKQTKADYVWVVTPDREIARHCESKGIPWRPSSESHPTGTHRVAEFLAQINTGIDIDAVINWQCDEPLVDPKFVDKLIGQIRGVWRSTIPIWTLVVEDIDRGLSRYNTVKVAMSEGERCHWFSRADMAGAYCHCGIYAYHPSTLRALGNLSVTRLSVAESLEQLSWLEHGYNLFGVEMGSLPLSINSPEDFKAFRKMKEMN